MDSWYLTNLVCPRDSTDLHEQGEVLVCINGHQYPVVEGIPVMLLDDVHQTSSVAVNSLRLAREKSDASGFYLDSIGISAEEKRGVTLMAATRNGNVDPVVSFLVSATNGIMYKRMIGNLKRYPVPDLPLPNGQGKWMLDVGCNWGRWCIAASKRGWAVVGIDPSLGAIMAARRVAQSMDLPIRYVVADGRFLPFPGNRFDQVFSYSVLQHLARPDVVATLRETARTLKPLGQCLVQMPNKRGLRSIYHQARRRFREASGFEVRYWRISDLRDTFSNAVGATRISIDCFGGLGIQKADWDLMPPGRKLIIAGSETLKKISQALPAMAHFADSLYVESVKSAESNVSG
jgi:2-polyprenyl-3-methyl-5-hydroxy-6-metoxy-1,4-benzoquinol methylase/uncharacterized protein YbaR (Trm112 family)